MQKLVVSEMRTFAPVSAAHWGRGDDILTEEIRRGVVHYWTVLCEDGRTNACGGKRFATREAAEKYKAKIEAGRETMRRVMGY